jgi:hypothetical protein
VQFSVYPVRQAALRAQRLPVVLEVCEDGNNVTLLFAVAFQARADKQDRSLLL